MTTYEFYEELSKAPHPCEGLEVYTPSETIPDMDMSPAEIVDRVVRHLPVPISHRPVFNLTPAEAADDNDDVFDAYVAAEDEFDLLDYMREVYKKKKPKDDKQPSEEQKTPSEEQKMPSEEQKKPTE